MELEENNGITQFFTKDLGVLDYLNKKAFILNRYVVKKKEITGELRRIDQNRFEDLRNNSFLQLSVFVHRVLIIPPGKNGHLSFLFRK